MENIPINSLLNLLTENELEHAQSKIDLTHTPLWKYWTEFVNISLSYGKSTHTILGTQTAIRFFLRHTELCSIEKWVDTLNVTNYLSQVKNERGWSTVTFNTYRKSMNTYFLFLERMGFIKENPIMRIIKMPELSKNMPTLTNADIKMIIGQLHTRPNKSQIERLRNLLFVQLAIITGARPKELLGLKFNSVDTDRKSICINGAKQKGKERYYELNNDLRHVLSSYIAEVVRLKRFHELENGLFISMSKKGRSWTYRGVNKLFQRISKEMGKQVTAYMFRRHACTELFAHNKPLQEIQLFMGHNRASTTYRYNYNSTRNTKGCTDVLYGI